MSENKLLLIHRLYAIWSAKGRLHESLSQIL